MLNHLAERLTLLSRSNPRGLRVCAVLLVLICAIGGGTMSLAPLVWNDSTTFVSSALATLDTGSLQLHAAKQPGYVAFLAGVFASGGTLSTAILIQQVLWIASLALLAYSLMRAIQPAYALMAALLAFYPGLQVFQNLILAESLYASAITTAISCVVLVSSAPGKARNVFLLVAAIASSGFAATLKAQGIPVLAMVVLGAMGLTWRHYCKTTLKAMLSIIMSAVLASSVVALAKPQVKDTVSALFGSKMLFCMHLDLVLGSPSTPLLAQKAMGSNAQRLIGQLQTDLQDKSGDFKTLGFYADKCQFDTELDRIGIEASALGVEGMAHWYREVFLTAVLQNPARYLAKVVRQLTYGLKMSVPPLGIASTYASEPNQVAPVAAALKTAGISSAELVASPIRTPVFAQHNRAANISFRAVSLCASFGMLLSFAGLLFRTWRSHPLAMPAFICSLIWFAQVGAVALTHTLDIWRYISPVAPAALTALALSLAIAIDLTRGRLMHVSGKS